MARSDVDGGGRSSASVVVAASARGVRVIAEHLRLVGEHDCLDAVAEVELLEDVRDVCLHGGVADVELLADLRVRKAAGNQPKDVELALGQLVEFPGWLWRCDAGELFDHSLRDRR